jgi:hypothetical protein
MADWRKHPKYQSYEVSDEGQVRSLDRLVANRWGGQHLVQGRTLATFVRKGGYLGGNLSDGGRRVNFEVHVMVAEAWHGERPGGMHVRHLDGDKMNNAPSNLQWDTISENMLDKIRHGSHHEANKTHCPAGHEYTEGNTYRAPSWPNKRQCRACMRIREAQRPPRPRRKAR